MTPRPSPLTSAVLLTLSVPALAQSAPDEDAPKQDAVELGAVDVHGVRGPASPKFTAPLLDTPKSVTVIPQAVIQQSGAATLLDALRTVPGITFGAGEGGNPTGDRPFIRGFDAQSDTFVDGLRDSGSQTREVFNLEQVEVIKGPGSAYSGRGSAGGSINLSSKTPKLDDFSAGSIGVGTDSYRRGTVDVNREIGDGIAARLNLMTHDADIAGRDEVNVSRWGLAPSIAFGLNSPTRLLLSHYHMETDDLPDAGGFPYNNPFSATNPNAPLNGDGSPTVPDRNNFYGLVDRDFQQTKADISTLEVSHNFGRHVLRNLLRHGDTRNDYLWTQPDDSKGNPILYGTLWRRTNSRSVQTRSTINQTSLTGDFSTGPVAHSYTAGLEYSEERMQRGSYTLTPGTNNPLTNNQACNTTGVATGYNCTSFENPNPHDPWAATHAVTRSNRAFNARQRTRTDSFYLFDTMEFSPKWLANLGVRFDDYQTTLNTPVVANGVITGNTRLANDSSFWNYQAGVVFKPVRNGSLYFSYGTSSTPPGMDGGDGADGISAAIQNLEPQDSENLELGAKWDVLDGKLALTSAVFRTEMNNARALIEGGTTQNVGVKRVEGIELGFSGNVNARWGVFGGYTYLDATLVDNGVVNTGTTANPVWSPSPLNGNRFPNTPRHSASIWTTYTFADLPQLTLGGGANYVGKVYGNTANTKWVPSYTRWDAMASYAFNPKYSLQLNVQNLGDAEYFTKAYASHYAAMAPGRSATLSFNFRFD